MQMLPSAAKLLRDPCGRFSLEVVKSRRGTIEVSLKLLNILPCLERPFLQMQPEKLTLAPMAHCFRQLSPVFFFHFRQLLDNNRL